jgi:hypothetical protein
MSYFVTDFSQKTQIDKTKRNRQLFVKKEECFRENKPNVDYAQKILAEKLACYAIAAIRKITLPAHSNPHNIKKGKTRRKLES